MSSLKKNTIARKIINYALDSVSKKIPHKDKEISDISCDCQKVKDLKLYVLWDEMGGGRIIGVFTKQETAQKIIDLNPHYYRLAECEPDSVTSDALRWMDEETKNNLKELALQIHTN